MAHSQQDYNEIRELAKGNNWNQTKQERYEELLEELETITPTDKTLRVAYQHIWGYFKKQATQEEKNQYKLLIEETHLEINGIEPFLRTLASKYQVTYLLNMRWNFGKEEEQ